MFARGDKIKDYEIIAPLRSGGMAMLYLARRRGVGGFSRLVALKLVHSHLAIDAGINRLFLREARIAASIAHPNVVNVEEVGEADGTYFIAMEYVHGVSLAELLTGLQKRRLRMSSKLSVWVAAQVAEALHAAHEAKTESGLPLHIVHRDVSPQNVLIGHTGHIKLIDFGIAKSPRFSRHATGGAVLGKLGYMAPEQLRGEPVDRRSDVYALGVMLWEMLTSRSLFRALRMADEQDWATRQRPPPPTRYSPLVTPALDAVVLRALAFEAADRFDSALEFRTLLLQAEPPVAEVDAPRLAGLMRTLLGDELERQRAGWPRDVDAELGVDTGSTTRAVNIDELTTRLRSADACEGDADDGEEPTKVMEALASRRRRAIPPVGEAPPSAAVPAPSCAIQTPMRSAPVPVRARAGASALARRQTLRAVALASFCVGFGTLSAAPASEPRTQRRELAAPAPSQPAARARAGAFAERVRPSVASERDQPHLEFVCAEPRARGDALLSFEPAPAASALDAFTPPVAECVCRAAEHAALVGARSEAGAAQACEAASGSVRRRGR